MASSRFSSSQPDLTDVISLVSAFQEMSAVKVEIRLNVVDTGMGSRLMAAAIAHSRSAEIGDQPPLASVSVNCSALNLRTLDAVLTHVLYMLDGQLASNELRVGKPNS